MLKAGTYTPRPFVALFSFLAVAAGAFALLEHLRPNFPRTVSFFTVALLLLATTLFWYVVHEPLARHAASFGLVAVFVVLADRWVRHGATRGQAVLLGTLLGAAWLVRTEAALVALLLPLLVFTRPVPLVDRSRQAIKLATGALLGLVPCLLLSGLVASYVLAPEEVFHSVSAVAPPYRDWSQLLFGALHGFLSWNPVAYIAVIGTIALCRRDKIWAAAALIMLAGFAWLPAPAQLTAFAGGSFTPVLPLLAPGLALAIDTVRQRPLLAVAPLILGAVVWNNLLMVQYTVGLVPKDAPVSFARMVRQQADVRTRSPFFYPFAFPANALFAWREGLPIDRYDLLALEPRREAIDLTFNRYSDRFLLDGWDAPGRDEWGDVWWTGSRRAVLALPIAIPGDAGFVVSVRTRSRLDEPIVEAELGIEVNGREIGRFVAPATAAGESAFTVPADAVGRIFRAGYNRIAFVSHGVARRDPDDERPDGPIARSLGSRAWPVAIYRLAIAPQESRK